MAKKWTTEEEQFYFKELNCLYVEKNKTIKEIGAELGIAEQTVFQRLQRLNIPSNPQNKKGYLKKRTDLIIPPCYSNELAEFFGIMLGDGHISKYQIVVTLGNKEMSYAKYIVLLMQKLFKSKPKIAIRKKGYKDVYLGSVDLSRWLLKQGLVHNKVKAQVDVPEWIFSKKEFMESFVRGFFDTDGSVYALKYGVQINLTNRSRPLLLSLQRMLLCLEYSPSKVSGLKIYITKRDKLDRFFREIKPKNPKHVSRYREFKKRVGTQAVNEDAL